MKEAGVSFELVKAWRFAIKTSTLSVLSASDVAASGCPAPPFLETPRTELTLRAIEMSKVAGAFELLVPPYVRL
jgi:hypothetical protein